MTANKGADGKDGRRSASPFPDRYPRPGVTVEQSEPEADKLAKYRELKAMRDSGQLDM